MRARLLLVASILLLAAGCGGHRAPDDRTIAIYAATIRAVLTTPGTHARASGPRETVFVLAANGGTHLSLDVQAGLVDALHNFATIRFVDERSEAIDAADPRKSVHENGVLVTLGKIPRGPTDVTIDVQRYEDLTKSDTTRVRLRRRGAMWAPVP